MSAQRFRLVAVSDNRGDASRIERVAIEAAEGGLAAICLREPDMPARRLGQLIHRLVEQLRPMGVSVLVSDRIDVAIAAGADGAQLGFRAVPLEEARSMAPRPFLIGISAHEGDDLTELARQGADYAFLGPLFDTPSKRGWRNAMGIEKVEAAASAGALPVLAIGGIELGTARGLARGRLAGMAVVRAIFESENPRRAAQALLAEAAS